MLPQLRTALIARITEIAPHLAATDFGEGVGFWTERVDFDADSPLDYPDYVLIDGYHGHVIGEIVADRVDEIDAALLVSLRTRRLRIDPEGEVSYGLLAELVSREDAQIEGAGIMVTQLRFAVTGGLYRHDPAPPVPNAVGVDDA